MPPRTAEPTDNSDFIVANAQVQEPKRVLVVEDDVMLAGILRCSLEKAGFAAIEAHDGEEALSRLLQKKPDAIVLDEGLPMTAEAARRIRDALNDRNVPIILLLPAGRQKECNCGRPASVDDCLAKPFAVSELIARLQTAIGYASPEILCYEDVVLDLRTLHATRGGHVVRVNPTELRFLRFFLENPRRVFSRETLRDAIWGSDAAIEPRTVDVHIFRLRNAITIQGTPEIIRTVRGGYAMDINATGFVRRKRSDANPNGVRG